MLRASLTNDGSKTYLYNQANQLTSITAAGLTWSASYNGDGARLRQIVNGVPTTYTLDLAAPLVTALAERTGATTKQYLYGLGDSPMAIYSGTAWTYLSGRDGLNSVRQETDASGNVLTARSFDPYGVPLDGNGGSPFGYTGEQNDATGLVFLRARYMQPGLGIFLTEDWAPGSASLPRSLHIYVYAWGDPVNLIDPSGLQVAPPRDCKLGEICYTGTTGPYNPPYSPYEPSQKRYYDRQTAVSYAIGHACSPNYGAYGRLPEDCTNFVSQALLAGGLPPTPEWRSNYPSPYIGCGSQWWRPCTVAWGSTPDLRRYLVQTLGFSEYFMSQVNQSNRENDEEQPFQVPEGVRSSITLADVAIYHWWDEGSEEHWHARAVQFYITPT